MNEIKKVVKEALIQKAAIKNPNSRYAAMLEIIKRFSSDSQLRVLDYGCGLGAFSHSIAELGHEVLGIDLASDCVSAAQECWELPGLSFSHNQISDLSSSTFDLVISQQVLEHTHNPGTYLAEINRVLRVGGKLMISVPNIANPRFFFAPVIYSKKRYDDYLREISSKIQKEYRKERDHIQAWDQQHFVRLVSTLGFSFEKYEPLEGVPLPWVLNRFLRFPLYVKLPGRLSNWCYTMAFLFVKTTNIQLDPND